MSIFKKGGLFFCWASFSLIAQEMNMDSLELTPEQLAGFCALAVPCSLPLKMGVGDFESYDNAVMKMQPVSDDWDWQGSGPLFEGQEQQESEQTEVPDRAVINESQRKVSPSDRSKLCGYKFRAKNLIAQLGLQRLLPFAQDSSAGCPGELMMKELAYVLMDLTQALKVERNCVHSLKITGYPEQLLQAIERWTCDNYQQGQAIDLQALRNYAGTKISDIISTVEPYSLKRSSKKVSKQSLVETQRYKKLRRKKRKEVLKILNSGKSKE